MYNVSEAFKKAITSNARKIKGYIVFKNQQYEIKKCSLEDNIYNNETNNFIGSFIAKNGTITINKEDSLNLENESFHLFYGVQLENEQYEYVPMGKFNIYDKVSNTEYKFMDNKMYFNSYFDDTEITYPITLLNYLKEVCKQAGINLKTEEFPNSDFVIVKRPFDDKYVPKLSEVVSAVAQVSCTAAGIDRNGSLELKWFKEIDQTFTMDNQFKIPSISKTYGPVNQLRITDDLDETEDICSKDDESIRTNGLTELVISDNPIFKLNPNALISGAWNKIKGFSYVPYSTTLQGQFHLDTGDVFKLELEDGSLIDVILMNHTMSYTGGIKSEISSPALSTSQIKYSQNSTEDVVLKKTIVKFNAQYLEVTKELKAVKATIQDLDVDTINADLAEIKKAQIKIADVETLLANKAYVNEAQVKSIVGNQGYFKEADIENLLANKAFIDDAKIERIFAEKGYVNDLRVNEIISNSGFITELHANEIISNKGFISEAQVNTLLAGKGYFTSVEVEKFVADKGFITELEVDELLADKVDIEDLEANYISTSKFDSERAEITKLIADRASIKDLEAATGRIGTLESSTVKTDKLDAMIADLNYLKSDSALLLYAKIVDLDATNANISTLTSKVATIEEAYIDEAKVNSLIAEKGFFNEAQINTLLAGKSYVTESYADTNYAKKQYVDDNFVGVQHANETYATLAQFGTLNTGIANINTLLSGTTVSGSIQTIVLNAENSTIENALIKDAMIDSLSFSKITGIDINTTNLNIHSNDGKSTWKDNTIQIKDASRTRVQMGKDSNGDYNIYIWDANGKLMFDPLGLTEDGITREVIDNSNVKEDAAIHGSKLDIDSVIEEVNDSTKTIKSSKIYFDEDKQTLDVVLKRMSSSNTDLTNKYNTINVDISNIKATMGEHTSSLGSLTNRVSTFEQNLNGFQTTVSNTYVSKKNAVKEIKQYYCYPIGVALEETQLQNAGDNFDPFFILTTPISIEGGRTYTVNWNGVSYQTQCIEINEEGLVGQILGDFGLMTGGDSTGEPFVIIVMPDEILETDGYSAQIMPLDGSTTLTISILGGKSSTVPDKPTSYPPSPDWYDTEQTDTGTSQYSTICTVYADGSFSYSDVTISNANELAMNAYGKAQGAEGLYNDFSVRLSDAESSIWANGENISNLNNELSSVKSRVSTAETKITQNTEAIELRATKSEVIETLKGYSTTSQMQAAIKTAGDSILSTVSSTYATQTSLNGLSTRMSSAEQKITADAIVSTVRSSSGYTNDLGDKVSKLEIISCINQTSESITIDASKINLNGYLTISNASSTYATKSALDTTNKNVTSAQNTANTASTNASSALTKANTANTVLSNWGYNGGTTTINGGKIQTGTITADKINVTDLFAQDITATGSITGLKFISSGNDNYGYPSNMTLDSGELEMNMVDGAYKFDATISAHSSQYTYTATGENRKSHVFINGNKISLTAIEGTNDKEIFSVGSIQGVKFAGAKVTDHITFSTGTVQSATKGIKWDAINSKNPYIGYATNQTDGTFLIASLDGTAYSNGLAIGGGSGNLLWKGTKVATINDNVASATKATQDGNGKEISRIYCSMIPAGTSIGANANLNTTTYLKVGNYYCSKNADAATLTNCPITVAFMMQVYSPLSTTIDNETTKTWVYRIRKITCYNTGEEYIQYCYAGSTAGSWSYGAWRKTLHQPTYGTAIGNSTTPIYINANGVPTACSSFATASHTHSEYALASHSHSNYALSSHTHDYLPLSGGTVTGDVLLEGYLRVNVYVATIGQMRFNNDSLLFFSGRGDAHNNTNRKGYIGHGGNTTHMTVQNEAGGHIILKTTGACVQLENSYGKIYSDGSFRPSSTNATQFALGTGNSPWKELFASSSTIAASDRNKKKDFVEFDERYERLFFDLKPQLFKFIDGESNRFHSGFISQDVEESLLANDLTALDFAGFCKDKKKIAKVDSTGVETLIDAYDENGNSMYNYSLRYEEFIALNTHMIQKNVKRIATVETQFNLVRDEFTRIKNELNETKQEVATLKAKLDAFIKGNFETREVV